MAPSFDLAADLDTPVSAWLKLAPLRPRFLLESVEGGERLGRYSVLGFGDAGEVRLSRFSAAAVREALARAPRLGPVPGGLPFAGGLVGVTTYPAFADLEPLAGGPPAHGPVGRYLAPRSLLVFDHVSRSAALLHDGPEDERRALHREVTAALRAPVRDREGRPSSALAHPSLDRDGFCDRVREVQRDIVAGELYQLVLSVRFAAEGPADPFSVYRALRRANPSPYLFFIDFGDLAVAGSSPEALARLTGRRATLRPIAGTRPRGASGEEDRRLEADLLSDPKEAAEHVMLVDLARNDLGRCAVPGTVEVRPYRIVERYSHVMHLVSGVEGVLAPEADALDLFTAAFPAGTVVGAPKIRAAQRIAELEPVSRGIYAGSVGYFGHGGAMDQAIAIRTLCLEQGRCTFQAGAGIVADSVPAREWEEVQAKAAVLDHALRAAGGAA